MIQQFYFVCSVGPVQDFIQTARTSQDLWFGSWLLSELSKAAAKALQGHELIFPAPKEQGDLEPRSEMDVTNKVVAIISGDPKTLGEAVEKAVKNRLMELAKTSFDAATQKGQFDRPLAEKQVAALTEFYWAAAPMEKGYKHARKHAEALLTARKNTRDFGQAHGKEGLPKSSLDGWRESVLFVSKKDVPYGEFKADKGEALSGIDLMKRLGERPGTKFISTTDVAAIPFELSLGEQCEPLRRTIQTKFEAIPPVRTETPGTMFYIDRLVQLIEDPKQAESFRREFVQIMRGHGEPSPYYALLLADGDNMGKTIDALTEQSQHSDLSQALSDFAPVAKKIILAAGGVPVYVGGDDVLAYLPVHTALACIAALNAKFDELIGSKFSFTKNDKQKHPSLSAGLAIAHHLTPLSDALDQARRAEKEAKQIDGKNALLISMSKRGGSERKAKGKLKDLVERMTKLVELTQAKSISHGAAYELEDLHKRMQNSALPAEALQKEAVRILKRKRESGGNKPVEQTLITDLETWLPLFIDKKGNLQLDKLASELILAAEIAAVMPKKEQQP